MTTERVINLPKPPPGEIDAFPFQVERDAAMGTVQVVDTGSEDVVAVCDLYAPPTVFTMLAQLADPEHTNGGMTEEQRVHAAFWSGYFYAEAMTR